MTTIMSFGLGIFSLGFRVKNWDGTPAFDQEEVAPEDQSIQEHWVGMRTLALANDF